MNIVVLCPLDEVYFAFLISILSSWARPSFPTLPAARSVPVLATQSWGVLLIWKAFSEPRVSLYRRVLLQVASEGREGYVFLFQVALVTVHAPI